MSGGYHIVIVIVAYLRAESNIWIALIEAEVKAHRMPYGAAFQESPYHD